MIFSMEKYLPTMNKYFQVKGAAEARLEGYKSLTRPYHINHKDASIRMLERQWWDNLCRDMQSCKCVIVEFYNGLEMWRHDDELDVDPMTGLKHSRKIDND